MEITRAEHSATYRMHRGGPEKCSQTGKLHTMTQSVTDVRTDRQAGRQAGKQAVYHIDREEETEIIQ